VNKTTRTAALLTALALGVTACGAVAHHGPPGYHGPPATISAQGKQVRWAPGVTLPASALQVSVPVSATWQISPSGKLTRPTVVTIPLTRLEPNDGLTMIFTAESPHGPWTPLKTKIVDRGLYAQATVTHLSWFTVVRISADEVVSVLRDFFNALTSDATSNASPPDCQGTGPQARADGYGITSASGSTVFWCFGMQNGSRVLKVVNNRRYPLLLIHGMPVIGGDGTGDVFQRAAELLSTNGVVAWPQSEIDFDATVQPGYWAGISANLASQGQKLYSLDVGVQALYWILSRFGFGDQPTKVMAAVNDLLALDTCRASLGNPGAMISNCLQSDLIDKIVGFGYSWVLSGIATITAVWEYFRGTLNGLADQFDGRSKYWITITHVLQGVRALRNFSAFVGRWNIPDESITITASGAGTYWLPDYAQCPTCTAVRLPINVITFQLNSVQGSEAVGTITSSTDAAGINKVSGALIPEAYQVGSTITLTLGSQSGVSQLQVATSGGASDQLVSCPLCA
jgi:hypothetical protein